MGVDIKRSYNTMGVRTRGMAFRFIAVVFCGTLVGSLLPELGTVLAYNLGIFAHKFNPYFLALGIIGFVLACSFRYR